ncbi:hypothetical protein HMPREF9318_00337 [Streptococcus urinalis FB127-CNA-2]|uniref:Transcriptional regulator, MarR family n=1 Tax=Streptococcus urinalis 2285-97 TaxID=764291 RepID=G5KFS8_9STRE|nr:MarR family transcriptional regulator [Streptococcus urinalis]EHJ57259.1 transcriptional regulator, MarR family [Streptococcus urinalis 2285-97]EKS22139.1 hypothetical protein HMPREF9318_00337 [Streptococcus urinalis FB127-CNA-2]VEF31951.1 transcriptional regulator [Streptococcus urinalis]
MDKMVKESKNYIRLFDQQISLYEHYARKNGLQGKSLQLLLWLYYNPNGITQSFLVEKTLSTKQVVNATVKSWLSKGFVTFQISPEDKRKKVIKLTHQGFEFAKSILKPLEQAEGNAQAFLKEQERKTLIKLVDKYTQALVTELEKI